MSWTPEGVVISSLRPPPPCRTAHHRTPPHRRTGAACVERIPNPFGDYVPMVPIQLFYRRFSGSDLSPQAAAPSPAASAPLQTPPHSLWCAFAKFYERHGDVPNGRVVFEKAIQVCCRTRGRGWEKGGRRRGGP